MDKKIEQKKTDEKKEFKKREDTNELIVTSTRGKDGKDFRVSLDRYKLILERISNKYDEAKILASGKGISRAMELITSRDMMEKIEDHITIDKKFEDRIDKKTTETYKIVSVEISVKFRK